MVVAPVDESTICSTAQNRYSSDTTNTRPPGGAQSSDEPQTIEKGKFCTVCYIIRSS